MEFCNKKKSLNKPAQHIIAMMKTSTTSEFNMQFVVLSADE